MDAGYIPGLVLFGIALVIAIGVCVYAATPLKPSAHIRRRRIDDDLKARRSSLK